MESPIDKVESPGENNATNTNSSSSSISHIVVGQATNARASKIIILGVLGFSFGRPMNEGKCRIEVINPLGYINISS